MHGRRERVSIHRRAAGAQICARTANGQMTATLPRSVTNSRLFIVGSEAQNDIVSVQDSRFKGSWLHVTLVKSGHGCVRIMSGFLPEKQTLGLQPWQKITYLRSVTKKPQATGTSAACVGGKLWRSRDSCMTGGELEETLDFSLRRA